MKGSRHLALILVPSSQGGAHVVAGTAGEPGADFAGKSLTMAAPEVLGGWTKWDGCLP